MMDEEIKKVAIQQLGKAADHMELARSALHLAQHYGGFDERLELEGARIAQDIRAMRRNLVTKPRVIHPLFKAKGLTD